MRSPNHLSVVFGIILNEKGEILLSRRGKGASSYPGRYEIPGGHIEPGETPLDAIVKELKEEICIDIKKEDAEFVNVLYSLHHETTPYVDFVFKINNFSGELKIGEPHKCEELLFVPHDKFEEYNVLKHNKLVVDNYFNGRGFSELVFKEGEKL